MNPSRCGRAAVMSWVQSAWPLLRHTVPPPSHFLVFTKASLWLVSPMGLSGCLGAAAIPGLQSVAGIRSPDAHGWVEVSQGSCCSSVLPSSIPSTAAVWYTRTAEVHLMPAPHPTFFFAIWQNDVFSGWCRAGDQQPHSNRGCGTNG